MDYELKNFEEALPQFIESLQLDRDLDDDGPRKACLLRLLYHAWGSTFAIHSIPAGIFHVFTLSIESQ